MRFTATRNASSVASPASTRTATCSRRWSSAHHVDEVDRLPAAGVLHSRSICCSSDTACPCSGIAQTPCGRGTADAGWLAGTGR